MTPDTLIVSGRLLFGDRWQVATAEALGVHRQHVWRYMTGKTPIPADTPARLARYARAEAGRLLRAADTIEEEALEEVNNTA